MLQEIQLEVLDRQIEKIGPNASWEQLFPDTMPMEELIRYTDASVERLEGLGKRIVSFSMALGRLLDIASKRQAEDWKDSGFDNFSDFQEKAYGKIRSHGSRYTALRMYRNLHDIPMEQLENCPIGNLNAAAKRIAAGGLSQAQKEELLQSAAKPRAEFEQDMEKRGIVPEGEAAMRSVTLRGVAVDVDYLEQWLASPAVISACGENDVDKILAAVAEFESTGGSAIHASVILRDLADDDRLPADVRAKIAEWSGTNLDQVIPGVYSQAE